MFNSAEPSIPNSLRTRLLSARAVKDAFNKYTLPHILSSDAHPHNKVACLFLNAYGRLTHCCSPWIFLILPSFIRRRTHCARMDMHRLWRASARSHHGARPSTHAIYASMPWVPITRAMRFDLFFSGTGSILFLVIIGKLVHRVWCLLCMLQESTSLTNDVESRDPAFGPFFIGQHNRSTPSYENHFTVTERSGNSYVPVLSGIKSLGEAGS